MGDISTYTLNNDMRTRVNTLNSQIKKDMEKVSSGQAISDMQDLANLGQTETLLGLQRDQLKTKSYQAAGKDAERQINFVERQLTSMIEYASEMKGKIVELQSSSGRSMDFTLIANQKLIDIENALNANYENKYVFSANNIFEKPVTGIIENSNLIDARISNNYYNGGTVQDSVIIADNHEIVYGISADNEAFQKLIAGVHTAIEADNGNIGPANIDKINKASKFLDEGINQLIQLRANLGHNQKAIADKMLEHQDYNAYVENLVGDIVNADIPKETALLTQHLTTLQAAFMMFSKVTSTKLVDYI